MSQISTPSIDRLKKAVAIAELIEKLQSDLASVLGGHSVAASASASAPAPAPAAKAAKAGRPAKAGGRRTMSPEARERIAAAQRARWAKSKGTAVAAAAPVKAVKAKSGRRTLSPEAREKIAAAARRRWAAVKRR